ncbi:MAG: hypothetical protein AAF086_02400 [Planctomycetota bacterium]
MLQRLIESWITRWPVPRGAGLVGVLLVAAIFTATAIGLGIPKLSVTPLGTLFDPADPGEQRYAAYKQAFDHGQEAIVLIDTGEQGRHEALAVQAAFALGESLEQERKIAAVHWGLNPAAVSPKLIRTLPLDDFQKQTTRLRQLKPLLDSETPTALLQAGMAEAMRGATSADAADGRTDPAALIEGAKVFVGLMETLTRRMQTPAQEPVDLWGALQSAAGVPTWELLRSASGRLLVLRVELLGGVDGEPGVGGSLAALRRQVETIRLRFEDVEIGITGYEPTRREAEAVIRGATMRAVGGAGLGLMLLTGLAWRSVWRPVVVLLLPGVAVTWTLGLIGGWWGEVNALAMVGVVVSGLGALFGGLMLAGVGAGGANRRAALRAVGPVMAGAGFVAVALGGGLIVIGETGWSPAAAGLVGLREAGAALVGGGVVAWGVVMILGPALLAERTTAETAKRESRGEIARLVAASAARRPGVAWTVTVAMIVVTVIVAARTPRTADTSGFLPADSEGAQWQQRALVQGGEWGMPLSLIASSMDEAATWTHELRALPEVSKVTGIGRLIPEQMGAKQEVLNDLDAAIGASARRSLEASEPQAAPPGDRTSLVNQVRLIRTGLEFLPASAKDSLAGLDTAMKESTDQFLLTADGLDDETRNARLASLDRDYATARQQAGRLVAGLLDPSGLTREDLSQADGLFDGWINSTTDPATGETTDRFLLKVYPASGQDGWPSRAELERFSDAVGAVIPEATGTLGRLLTRGDLFVAFMHHMVLLVAGALLGTLLICGAHGRAWLGGGLAVVASAMVLVAAVGGLSASMTAMSWAVWPVIGTAVVLWVVTCAGVKDKTDPQGATARAAGGEAFGLMLAAGFLAAAGLRSAGAPGLTATAVAACLAVGIAGLWVLLLVAPAPGAAPGAGAGAGAEAKVEPKQNAKP